MFYVVCYHANSAIAHFSFTICNNSSITCILNCGNGDFLSDDDDHDDDDEDADDNYDDNEVGKDDHYKN